VIEEGNGGDEAESDVAEPPKAKMNRTIPAAKIKK
jgi:hypothetical protein